jgi:hypothetical protein
MVAFLKVDMWRAYDALAFARTMFGCPMLGTRWMVAPDGRLTCRWQTDGAALLDIPPD